MVILPLLVYLLKPHLVYGSIDSMEVITSASIVCPLIFMGLFCITSYFYFKRPDVLKLIVLLIWISLWLLSGRMIGIVVWPDIKVNIGWFDEPTESINLCARNADCETIVAQKTKATALPFWRLRIENPYVDQVIFVGPFIWGRTLKMFNEKLK